MRISKKGLVEEGLLQWIGIILAIILIAGTAYFFANLSGIFGGGQKGEGTVKNVQFLAQTINEMIDVPGECVYAVDNAFYIDSGFILVGFNKDEDFIEDACKYELVNKPEIDACSDSACLCLYRDPRGTHDDFVDNPPVFCEALKSKTSLAADYVFTRRYYMGTADWIVSKSRVAFNAPENVYKNIIGMPWGPPPEYGGSFFQYIPLYSYFFIYGECGAWGFNKAFGSALLYIEVLKAPKTGKNVVFIAHSTPELIQDRVAIHKQNNLLCREY